MQQANLEVQPRDRFGKQQARDLRKAGGVPAVLYGRAQETVALQLDARTFRQFLRTYGENVIINMEVSAGTTETVIIKDIQRHPVDKQRLIHADFIRISLDEPVTSAVPLVFVGNPPGVQLGGVLETPLRSVSLRCLPIQMPTELRVDVSNLEIGDTIHVSALTLDEDIQILDELDRTIAIVSQPRVQLEEETEDEDGEGAEEEGAEEPTEPEVISRRRGDDEE